MGKRNRKIVFKRNIALSYFIMIILGTILLFSPITTSSNNHVSLIDAFFVSASAFTDTGLTPISIHESFNRFGQIVILILVQVGAIGLMTMKAVLFLLINKKISTADRMMIHNEQRQTKVSGMVKLIKDAVLILLSAQILFTIIVTLHMVLFYDHSILNSLWFSYFHVTSALTNVGFDLTGSSLAAFSTDYLFQSYIMFLIILGGLGFPVLIDIKRYCIARKNKESFRFSLFSKISFYTYFIVGIIGFIIILFLDYEFIFVEQEGMKGVFYALFQVVSSRSCGLVTLDLNSFSSGSQLVLGLLMFIGAAPASTGGGVRTTTIALMVLYLINFASNKRDVEAFNRRIPMDTIFKAFVSFSIGGILVVLSSVLIIGLNSNVPIIDIVFEVTSAFGTTGMSLGITKNFEPISKIIIALLMMIGQLGITNAMIVFSRNKEDSNTIRLPEEN
ncbi:hypothetical protein LJB88_01810, partial [Erysipelotrichaceae bacterium OttesenSCG-928-M19]|nr:hypothetical protein [Erysipelotrichaceae bacterium OttesenSCG-928-M19]